MQEHNIQPTLNQHWMEGSFVIYSKYTVTPLQRCDWDPRHGTAISVNQRCRVMSDCHLN